MIDDTGWARLARYASGECKTQEEVELRRWIEADPERIAALDFMQQVNRRTEHNRPTWDGDRSWNQLLARKAARERRLPVVLSALTPIRASRWRLVAAVAAAAVVVVALAPLLLSRDRDGVMSPVTGPTPMREYVTARGQRATLSLPDGSRVTLGVASRLRYSESFPRSARRELFLEGEALFEVKHDPKRPFLVYAADAVTEDVGTAFSVRAYPTDTTVRVVVTEGKVELRGRQLPVGHRGVLLVAGQLGDLNRRGNVLVRSDLDVGRHVAWVGGRLNIDDTPLREALPQLSRWYDLEFALDDEALGRRMLTASFSVDEPVDYSLNLLASTLDLRYEQVGRTVRFWAKGRPR